jgi:hypothetical protein
LRQLGGDRLADNRRHAAIVERARNALSVFSPIFPLTTTTHCRNVNPSTTA